MKKTFSRVRLILVQLLVCLALVAGVLMFSVAPAHAASTPHTTMHPDGSGCYLVIYYNHGNYAYCVNTTGYNGINRALYYVTEIDASGCTNAYWIVYHTSETSSGIKLTFTNERYNYVDFYKLTQVDVYATSCTP